MRNFFLLIFIVFNFLSYSQSQYEFFGVLRLYGNEKNIISYRLVFNENNGKISGYSITDLDGAHETKNEVFGTFDKSKKNISFYESNILYTKSKLNSSVFCYVNFEGKINLEKTNGKLDGSFKGMYKNKIKCIDGTLTLVSLRKIENTVDKLTKKINKSKKIDPIVKERYNPVQMLDSLKINKLNKDENLNVFWKSKQVRIEVWDAGKEDGDIINLYHNEKLLLSNYMISNVKKSILLELEDGDNIFKIVAVNEGNIQPNTSQISLGDSGRFFELMANLKKGDQANITIVKN